MKMLKLSDVVCDKSGMEIWQMRTSSQTTHNLYGKTTRCNGLAMNSILSFWLLIALNLPVAAADKKLTVKSFAKSLIGQTYFLKIDAVEVNFGLRGVDAANVYADGTVSYRARVNALSQIQAQSGEDFAEDARVQIANMKDCMFCAVRRIERGTPVTIKKANHDLN